MNTVMLMSGCAGLIRLGNGGGVPAQGGRYEGDECGAYQADGSRGLRPDTPAAYHLEWTYDDQQRRILFGERLQGSKPVDGAVLFTCIDMTMHIGGAATKAILADHAAFDDRHFDHLRAAVMVLECALDKKCGTGESVEEFGVLAGYARRVDPAAAEQALLRAGVGAGLRSAFGAKVTWARAVFEQRVQGYSARGKAIWIDIPEQVWTERQEYFTKWAKLYAAFDPLVAAAEHGQGDARGIGRQIRTLRGEYLAACKVEGCLFTPFVWESTRALALLAVRANNPTEVLAEAQLIEDSRMQAQDFAHAMFLALVSAAAREQTARKRYDTAKNSGASDAALEAMFGPVPPHEVYADTVALKLGDHKVADLTAAIDRDGFLMAGGKVRSIVRHGDRATVMFSDEVYESVDADCHDTNQIDSISADGKVNYRRACTNYRPHTSRQKVDPIDIPADEAVPLRAGDLALAWVSGKPQRGSLFAAQRDKRIVQVRGHRLHASEPLK